MLHRLGVPLVGSLTCSPHLPADCPFPAVTCRPDDQILGRFGPMAPALSS
jgi:hypothetical protein